MHPTTKFITTLGALGCLLGHVGSQATDLAELPLKASVLAKPNIIFGMDDSGSMDWEIMLNGTFQGIFYGNYRSTTLYPGGALRTGTAQYDWPYYYLFPNGTGDGNRVYGDPDNDYGYALPPVLYLAWLRSPAYNSQYYDTLKTYEPWAPAVLSGSSTTSFGVANPAAARSHPVLGTSTMVLNANVLSTDTQWRFTFTPGMVIPSGTGSVSCDLGTKPAATLTANYTVTVANEQCKAAISYYPATFWNKETCTTNSTDCTTAWDGATIKRYEIKSNNSFPSGRTYTAEMQNFANWFTYYRKRKLMLAGSMGDVLENLSGVRMGVVPFNTNATVTMYDADTKASRLAVSGIFYKNSGAGDGTPTHTTQAYIYSEFDTNTNVVRYACQRNASFIITDGFSNDNAVAAPTYEQSTFGAAAPYQSITAASLADKALAHYTRRLRNDLTAGAVPTYPSTSKNPDNNTNLHVNTYALTLGMRGTVWPSTTDPFVTAPVWPTPVKNSATMIDDLWHATINGRGQMYLATSPQETYDGLTAAIDDILKKDNAQAGVAVSSVNLQAGDGFAYLSTYNAAGWAGNLTANEINSSTAVITDKATWEAAPLLAARDWTTRNIASSSSGGGVGFTATEVGGTVNPSSTWGTTADVMNYLRGDRSKEGSDFRRRNSLMGALINAEPVISSEDKIVYVASGEGMLHAFDTTKGSGAGQELWAYVPEPVLADIGQTSARGYAFKTQLDGTPVIGKISTTGSRLLVAGMGAAGKHYYALDVSNARSNTQANASSWVRWTFPAIGDTTYGPRVGQTVGRPLIIKTAAGYRVVVTSGYNSTHDSKGRVFVLDPSDGSVLKEFTTDDGSLSAEAGLAHISPYLEDDGTVRYVYGGDLLGNLWRFDLDANTGTAPHKIAVLKNSSNQTQPVTAAPELAFVNNARMVLVGTGRLMDVTDWGNTQVQTFYAITDGATLSNARSSLAQQVYTRSDDKLTSTAVDWGGGQRGWYLDMPSGEHANTRPSIVYGGVAWVTNMAGANDCSASSYLYVLDVASGGRSANNTTVSVQLWDKANSTGVNAVVTADGDVRGIVRSYDGNRKNPTLANEPPIPASKNAWREVQR
jgi:type IV pilus assembly protein PilY1